VEREPRAPQSRTNRASGKEETRGPVEKKKSDAVTAMGEGGTKTKVEQIRNKQRATRARVDEKKEQRTPQEGGSVRSFRVREQELRSVSSAYCARGPMAVWEKVRGEWNHRLRCKLALANQRGDGLHNKRR